jgi:hypothetical protein
MTSKEINFMPPLKMGKTTYQRTRKASRHFNELEPKSFPKSFIKVELKTS